ncbi:hypothetical protein [Aeoliella sp. SH292]|uniref:hypothetical protein n=1 Tax=Aeoliella sp. SH292 TaxID=3454464 RepID=UPI003F9BD9B3
MAESADTPRWELLPRDPVGFFELSEGFDRKDLKRAYNRLLRIYKPEKYPSEFQQIRQAYEELDEQLRYHGSATSRRVAVPEDWQTDAEAPQPATPTTAAPKPSEPTLVERLKTESPAAIFEELKARQNKQPYDYYALALLSDIVERSPTGFAKWLIEGIAAHRRDGALKQLLHDYFRGPQTGELLVKLLPAVAKAVRTDEFYPLTEPAWRVVLRECDFRKFAAAYDACEAELRDSHIVGRMAFLIHMLKSAMWRDPETDGWSARQFRFVEENFSNIPPWLEWDVEVLGLAREYLAIRDKFVSGSPLRTKIDAALKEYFSESQELGDRAVVAAQMEVLAAGDTLMHEFPLDMNEVFHAFYPIWAWASHDVAERQAFKQDEEVNENVWATRALALLARMEKECNNSLVGVMWSTALAGRVVTICLSAIITFVVLSWLFIAGLEAIESRQPWDVYFGFGGLIILILSGVAAWFAKPWLDKKLWFPLNEEFARKCYDRMWRRELLDFQRRSHVPDRFFRALFAHFADRTATSSWVNQFVQQDFAAVMLAGAQRYEA